MNVLLDDKAETTSKEGTQAMKRNSAFSISDTKFEQTNKKTYDTQNFYFSPISYIKPRNKTKVDSFTGDNARNKTN